MRINEIFKNWWRKSDQIKKYGSINTVNSMTDIPGGSLSNKIYLVSRNNKDRWLVFDCPRGHGERIEVNLMSTTSPSWRLSKKNKKVSLYPSVAVNSPKCDCHFWLKNNIAYIAYWI